MLFRSLLQRGEPAPGKSDWNELLQWAAAPTSDWLHASNLAPDRLMEIASAIGVPHVMIEAALHESSYPRIESGARWTALTASSTRVSSFFSGRTPEAPLAISTRVSFVEVSPSTDRDRKSTRLNSSHLGI